MSYDPRKHGALCDKCPRKGSVVVPPEGPASGARACWLGQDPGKQEVVQGRPFVGPTGSRLARLWDEAFAAEGSGSTLLRRDIWVTNAALCAPPEKGGDAEARAAMTCCRPRLARELKRLDPGAGILAMGKWAWFALTGSEKGSGPYQGFHVMVEPEEILSEADEVGAEWQPKKKKEQDDE
jgi:uracil-DNA glycosylase